MMNNECERVGLPVPRITDNGFLVKVIFKRPSADGYKKHIIIIENDTVNTEKDSVKDTVEHQLNTGRTPVIVQKDTSSTEKEHQLEIKKAPVGKRNRQELRIINIIGEDWYSATDLREALNYKSKKYLYQKLSNSNVRERNIQIRKRHQFNFS